MMPHHSTGSCVVNQLETRHTTHQENYWAKTFYSAKGCCIHTHIHKNTRGIQLWRSQELPPNANQYVRGESQLFVCLLKQVEHREEVYIQPVSFLDGSWQVKALYRSLQPEHCAL